MTTTSFLICMSSLIVGICAIYYQLLKIIDKYGPYHIKSVLFEAYTMIMSILLILIIFKRIIPDYLFK